MNNTMAPALEAVLSQLRFVQPVDNGYMAQCPSCRTRDARSLFVAEGDVGGVRLWCQHGCSYPAVVGMLGLPWEDVMSTEPYGTPDVNAWSPWMGVAMLPTRVGSLASIAALPAPIAITQAEADAMENAEMARFEVEWARRKAVEHGVLMSEVECEEVSWLWPGHLPLGKLTVIDGDPGLGKSFLTLDLAARVSQGRTMPDGSHGVAGG